MPSASGATLWRHRPLFVYGESGADRVQKFRSKATELREKAAKLPDSDLRQQFIDLAREYDALATVIERRLLRK